MPSVQPAITALSANFDGRLPASPSCRTSSRRWSSRCSGPATVSFGPGLVAVGCRASAPCRRGRFAVFCASAGGAATSGGGGSSSRLASRRGGLPRRSFGVLRRSAAALPGLVPCRRRTSSGSRRRTGRRARRRARARRHAADLRQSRIERTARIRPSGSDRGRSHDLAGEVADPALDDRDVVLDADAAERAQRLDRAPRHLAARSAPRAARSSRLGMK